MSTHTDTATLPDIEADALTSWLVDLGLEVAPPLVGHRVGLGQSNLTYLLEDARGGRWVLRRPPLGHLLESAHDMAREYRILAALATTDVPVPRMLGLLGDGRDQIVMDHVDGVVIDRMDLATSLSQETRGGVGPSLARALAALHMVDIDQVGLHDLASRRPYAPRQLRRWSRQLDASRTRALPDLDRLTALLSERVPEPDGLVLVHGDMHVRNVICSPETGQVRAVLDWELSTLGEPLADLGTLLAYWWESDEAPEGFFAASALPGFVSRDELVTTYVQATGCDLAALGFWHVLGMWKIAIIAEGVRRRALDEPRNAVAGGPPGAGAIDHLVNQAWDLVHHYRL